MREVFGSMGNYIYGRTNSPSPGSLPIGEIPVGVINGVNNNFTISNIPVGLFLLFRNGLVLIRDLDYTLTGVNITFLTGPPQIGDVIHSMYWI